MTEKAKGGAGKFFLGAALGAMAGAIAGKFVSTKKDKCNCDKINECGRKASTCECDKKSKQVSEIAKDSVEKAEKKPAEKKSADKK